MFKENVCGWGGFPHLPDLPSVLGNYRHSENTPSRCRCRSGSGGTNTLRENGQRDQRMSQRTFPRPTPSQCPGPSAK